MSNENELENIGDALPAISTDTLINIANKAEARIEAVKKIKTLSLKVTNYQDWIDQNGKPYLQTSGGEKIARLFGISWTVEEPHTQQDGDEGHYLVMYKGIFTLGNASIECIGTRSSKDGFFKKYKEGKEQPAATIDIGDVVKSAYTNLIGNGITRLLGIRNLTYDDLAESGIDVSKITKVEYKSKVKMPQNKSASTTTENLIKIRTIITNVTQFECKNKSIKYSVYGENENKYSTFDEKIATFAKSLSNTAVQVEIRHKADAYKTIESIDIVSESESEPENNDRYFPTSGLDKLAEETARGLNL